MLSSIKSVNYIHNQLKFLFSLILLANLFFLPATPSNGQINNANFGNNIDISNVNTYTNLLPDSKYQTTKNLNKPFVIATNGKAFKLQQSNGLGVKIIELKTSKPVFKAFGMTSDEQKLLYTPLKNGFPSGELFLEDLTTRESIKVTSRLILSASLNPANENLIAYTFAGNENFGLAFVDLSSDRNEILADKNVFAENIEWDSNGDGIHYFETSIPEPTLKQEGIIYSEVSPKSGELDLKNKYISINSYTFSSDFLLPNMPKGFPVLEKSENTSLAEETKIEYAFRTAETDDNYEVFGENLLGISSLYVREISTGETSKLGVGQLVKVLNTGVIFKEFLSDGTKIKFVDWKGNSTTVGMTMVNYNLPVQSSVMIQGGTGYSSPGNCGITAHTGSLEYAYDFQSQNVGQHVMASAGGLVVFNTSNVTCNTIDTSSCPDYNSNGCPGSYLGNVVIIQHADGSYSKYAHMETNSPQVAVGTTVDQGLYIGRQGHTGSTSGTFNGCGDHVHFQLQSSPDIFGQSIAVDFADVATEPLSCGTTYTSGSTEISHSISPSSQNFGISGGSGTVNITSTGGTWSAVSNDSWITINSASSGTGNSVVNYTVSDNSANGQRTGTMIIGGHVFTVSQTGGGVNNLPPTVNAGNDQAITLPSSATLSGTASDDGLPNPPATLTTTWSKVSGPGTVTFGNANALNTTANFSIAGIYTLRLTASDSSLNTTDDLTVIVNTNNGGGLLSGNQTQPAANTNLTTEGTADWSHWGLTSSTDLNYKNGVTQQIGNFTQIGSITPLRYTNSPNSFSWTDGTPNNSISGTTTGIYVYGIGNGFQMNLPADTTQRTLKLYVGLWAAGGKLEATLSDGSASPFIDTSLISMGVQNGVYTLNYKANSSGQTLNVKWTIDSNSNALGNVTLQAATLSTFTPPTNQTPTVNAGSDQTVVLPSTASLSGTANDDGLPNPPATLTTTWSKVSGPGTVTFGNANALNTTASFSTNGTYVLRLTANDSLLTNSDDVTITVNNSGGGGGSIGVSNIATPTNVNLTTEGTADWAHWGLNSTASFTHKNNVVPQISNFIPLGNGSIQRYTNNPNLYSWSDGTPIGSASNTSAALYVIGQNNGFQITVPADTTQRTLKLYVGLWAAGAKLEATLSDGSAAPYVDTSTISSNSTVNKVYTLNYQAASSGQTLTIKWTVNTTFNQWSNVTLQAAALLGNSIPINQAPTVNAGIDQAITLPSTAGLNGTANDDGLPNPPATLTTTWSKVSGPGTVTFGNVNSLNTTASFSSAGTYTLRLTATDGTLSTTDDVVITVNPVPTNQPPTVNAGNDQTIVFPASASLSGSANDDGLPNPPATLTTTWSKVSGPGTVTFGNANSLNTTASFSVVGTYVLRLTANDSSLSATDDVSITVNNSAPTNQPPTVNAGNDQTITLPSSATLSGTANDDGLPNPPATLTTTWSKVSGPGTVTFGNANLLNTNASFSTNGVYVLRLTANDSALSANDDVSITVNNNTGAGTLTSSIANTPANTDLTTEGTADWAHWGLNSTASFTHKNNVVSQISNFIPLGNGSIQRYTNNPNLYSWSDGTPIGSASNTSAALYVIGQNNGFQITVPADTTQRTLKLYVGLWAAGAKLEATLSDGSAAPYVDTSTISSNSTVNKVYTLNYQAASSGQTLTIKWTVNTTFNQWSNVTLQAATLVGGGSGGGGNPPPASEYQISSSAPYGQMASHIASNSSGEYVVAWQSNLQDGSGWGIFARKYNASGSPIGNEFQVNTYTAENQFVPRVGIDSAGNFVIVWESKFQDGDSYGIYGQRFNSAGNPVGSEFRVNTTTVSVQHDPFIAMKPNGDFVVVWVSDLQDGSLSGIFGQRFNSAGVPIGNEFQINTFTNDDQRQPTVSMDDNGNFLVTWQSYQQDGNGWGIYAQRFDSAGAAQGSEFKVNTFTNGDQYEGSGKMTPSGDFIITWSSDGQDGSGAGVYAQRYNSAGVPQGGEFRVNTFTNNDQNYSNISATTNGNFVIVWQSRDEDGSGIGAFGQLYNSAGIPISSELQLNTYIFSDQTTPFVSMDSAGNFTTAWTSSGQDGSAEGVFGKRFDASGNELNAP